MSLEILNVNEDYADYLRDESRRAGHAEKIVFPKSANEVREALQAAAENNWPVTVQGGRTGITGGCVPEGGLILNLSRMNAIGEIKGDQMTVQSGALLDDIRKAVCGIADPAMFFPPDPTETTASIGGMVANNASGARSFKYGAVRNWIHALEVVLANGETIWVERGKHKVAGLGFKLGSISGEIPIIPYLNRCGTTGVKNAAGYFVKPDMDLVDLFIGAEGTLGIVTEITIKLLPKPEQLNCLVAFFASEEEALGFVRFLRGAGSTPPPTACTAGGSPAPRAGSPLPPTAIEFFDAQALELLRRMKAGNTAFADLPELKTEFHTAIYFEYDTEVPDAVVEKAGEAIDCWFAEGEHEIETLKNFRHAVPEAVNMLIGERKKTIPELTKLGTDMSVPDDQMETVMHMYHEGLAEAGLEYAIFGHIGNNHVHVNIIPRSMEEYEAGKALYLDWARQVVAMSGSVSAEHGIGKNKTDFLRLMYGDDGICKMRKLKHLFDPAGLLNPGNLFL
ncbi:MAG: FAD-binding oxidoreductase [Verrucomicrobiota bacterium]